MSHRVRFYTPKKSGYTVAEEWESFGVPLDDEPELPYGSGYLLEWFYQLNARRPPGFDSPAAIPYSEIEAWARLTDSNPRPHEVDALTAMDSAFLEAVHEFREQQRQEKPKNG